MSVRTWRDVAAHRTAAGKRWKSTTSWFFLATVVVSLTIVAGPAVAKAQRSELRQEEAVRHGAPDGRHFRPIVRIHGDRHGHGRWYRFRQRYRLDGPRHGRWNVPATGYRHEQLERSSQHCGVPRWRPHDHSDGNRRGREYREGECLGRREQHA